MNYSPDPYSQPAPRRRKRRRKPKPAQTGPRSRREWLLYELCNGLWASRDPGEAAHVVGEWLPLLQEELWRLAQPRGQRGGDTVTQP